MFYCRRTGCGVGREAGFAEWVEEQVGFAEWGKEQVQVGEIIANTRACSIGEMDSVSRIIVKDVYVDSFRIDNIF